jgi:hypothetical protein
MGTLPGFPAKARQALRPKHFQKRARKIVGEGMGMQMLASHASSPRREIVGATAARCL